jgi:hypothetical protein
MLAATQDSSEWSNFCNKTETDENGKPCHYFSTANFHPRTSGNYGYEFCDLKFPLGNTNGSKPDLSQDEGLQDLGIPQFAMLSSLAYEGNSTFNESLEKWFKGWTITDQRRVDHVTKMMENSTLHYDWTTWFELLSPNKEATVFVIRGTLTPLEVLQDMNVWAPIAIPQAASMFGPDLTAVAAHAVMVLSTAIYGGWMQKNYYSALLKKVNDTKRQNPHRRFYITGHSLGGGLANLVSMETDIPAITFASPGIGNTRMLVAASSEDDTKRLEDSTRQAEILHRLSYAVVPDNDLVSRVDTQLGTQIRSNCNNGNPKKCHSLGETLCDLLLQCGSTLARPVTNVNCALCPNHVKEHPDVFRELCPAYFKESTTAKQISARMYVS